MMHPEDLPSTLQNRSNRLVLSTFHAAGIRKQGQKPSATLLFGLADGILEDPGIQESRPEEV